jgi:hypothetical protein
MCKSFSCIVDITGQKVTWKLGVDSHTDLVKLAGYKDLTADPKLMEFAKIEITPKNGDYLNPDKWVYKVDESPAPIWIGREHEDACRKAHAKWQKQLDEFIIRHPIVHPFKLTAPEVGTKQVALLKKWDSVGASVGASVWDSVGDSVRASVWASVGASVGDSVGDSVWASVWASVGDSVGDSVWDSVGASVRASVGASVWDSVRASVWDSVRDSVRASVRAYTGSFFKIPVWKYVKHPKGKYPYQPLVDLWNQGFVPSFDGTTWRLHAGPKAAIVYSITAAELKGTK